MEINIFFVLKTGKLFSKPRIKTTTPSFNSEQITKKQQRDEFLKNTLSQIEKTELFNRITSTDLFVIKRLQQMRVQIGEGN